MMALLKKGDRVQYGDQKGVVLGVGEGQRLGTVRVRFDNGVVSFGHRVAVMDLSLVQPAGRVRRLIDRIKTLERQLAQLRNE